MSTDDENVPPAGEEPGGAQIADPVSAELGESGPLTDEDGLGDEPLNTTIDNYVPSAPAITGLRPRMADRRGGTSITIFGAGFAPGCRVFVDEEELIGEVVDAFTIRFVAPPCEAATARVAVESASGKRSANDTEIAYSLGPDLERAIPDEVPLEGGVHVILEGERFAQGISLNLFGVHAPELSYDSDKRASFLAPPAGDGPLEGMVIVTNPNGLSGKSETIFRYRRLEPQIDSIDPARGWLNGGKVLVVTGEDLHERVEATIGGRPATLKHKSRTSVEIEVPPAEVPGAVDVVLTNPDGRAATVAGGFTYEPIPAPPKIIDAIPRTGLTLGGATIRITGDNFTDDVRVKIGEVTAMKKVISSKLIDVELPPRKEPGTVAVEVSLAGVIVRHEDLFTYESPRAPKISHLEPRTGPTGGGTKIVIEGESFPKNATVRFGGELAKSVIVRSPQKIEAVSPARSSAGLVDVEVSSPETGPGIAKAGFKYETTPPPAITLVSPNKGTIDGGTELSIEGKNFAEGAVVLVGGVAAKTRRISGSVLEANTPSGDDGKLVDVAVKNPDGQQAIQKRAFQYDARYRS